MTRRHPLRALFAGLMLGILGVAAAGPAAADPHEDKARVDQRMAQVHSLYEAASARAQTALAAYSAATAQLPAAHDRVAVARGVVAAREAAARQAARDAAAARAQLSQAQQRYQDASAQVDAARAQIGDFVAASYKGSGLLTFDSLLESPSPGDLVDRLNYLEKSAQEQTRALDTLRTARLAAKDAQNQATTAQRAADSAAYRAGTALDGARAAESAAEQDQASLTALIGQQQQALAAANAERAATLAQYEQLQQESNRIAAQLRAMSGGVAALHRGHFRTPVHGWKSSDFGWRYDPFYRVWQLHAGVDLAAPQGTPIYAAGDGTVVQAGWDGGYGNYTCLYHGMYQGKGLSTCYGHQSVILVHVGQRVSEGDLIGRVGTTGASTGDHLHFEVRINGAPVQPLGWLDPCLC